MRRILVVILLTVGFVAPVQAQLNQNCVVSVLNRTVQVKPNGTWVVPNIPANFGRVRARATCVENGLTRSGESAYFTLASDQSINIPPIVLGPTTPVPASVTLQATSATLNQQNRTAQITVTGRYS